MGTAFVWLIIIFIIGACSLPFIALGEEVYIVLTSPPFLTIQKGNLDIGRYTPILYMSIGWAMSKIVLCIVTLILKWTLIFRIKPDVEYSRYRFFELRKLIVNKLIHLCNQHVVSYFAGTYAFRYYFR